MFFCEERFQDNGHFALECYSLKRPGQPERQQPQFSQENLFSQIYSLISSVFSTDTMEKVLFGEMKEQKQKSLIIHLV